MAKIGWRSDRRLASFLLVAPVIESGTSGSTQLFQAVGNADSGGGGD